MTEQPLPGGAVTAVSRVGDTVRRTPPPDRAFTRALLRLFQRRGWDGAPRFLGTDEQGREVLSFLDGHAYGLRDRDHLVDTVLWWQDRCWRGILAKAQAGEPAMIRLGGPAGHAGRGRVTRRPGGTRGSGGWAPGAAAIACGATAP